MKMDDSEIVAAKGDMNGISFVVHLRLNLDGAAEAIAPSEGLKCYLELERHAARLEGVLDAMDRRWWELSDGEREWLNGRGI